MPVSELEVFHIKAYLMRVDESSGEAYRGYLAEVDNDLKAEQLYVNFDKPDGCIQVINLIDNICAIINDEGKLRDFPINRVWLDEFGGIIDFIVGNIMCVRHDNEGGFTSILPCDVPVIERLLVPIVPDECLKEWC